MKLKEKKSEKEKIEDELAKRLAYLFLIQLGYIKGSEADIILNNENVDDSPK
jgi:hypothetical protein